METGVVEVMKMGCIAPRAGFGPTLLAMLGLACKPLIYRGSLMQSPYPCLPVDVVPCLAGQRRQLTTHMKIVFVFCFVILRPSNI